MSALGQALAVAKLAECSGKIGDIVCTIRVPGGSVNFRRLKNLKHGGHGVTQGKSLTACGLLPKMVAHEGELFALH